MKIKHRVTLYVCDFCNKKLQVKGAMQRHEERCNKNPANDRPCLNCPYLENKEVEYDTGMSDYYNGETIYAKSKNGFFCSKKQIMLLHPSTQWKKHSLGWVLVDGEETKQFDMPESCDILNKYNSDMNEVCINLGFK